MADKNIPEKADRISYRCAYCGGLYKVDTARSTAQNEEDCAYPLWRCRKCGNVLYSYITRKVLLSAVVWSDLRKQFDYIRERR